eukprot:11851748-Karenia_brevis.AAC.1
MAQFLQQAKDGIHTGLAATSDSKKADTQDLWKSMESLFHQVINPLISQSSQPSQPSQPSPQPQGPPTTQPGGDAAGSQPSTAHKRESPLDG